METKSGTKAESHNQEVIMKDIATTGIPKIMREALNFPQQWRQKPSFI